MFAVFFEALGCINCLIIWQHSMSVTAIVSKISPSKILLVGTFREIFVPHVATLLENMEEPTHILAERSVLLRTTQKPIVPVIRQPCLTWLRLGQNLGNSFSVCVHTRSHDDSECSCCTILLLTFSGCFAVFILRHFNCKWFATHESHMRVQQECGKFL
jgi:hypothetical protein